MTTITLITKTNIIIKIFDLVCNKLDVDLIVVNKEEEIKNSDVLIFEDTLFNENNIIRYKSLSHNINILAKEKIYEYEEFNIINKPFLPSQLSVILKDIINKGSNVISNYIETSSIKNTKENENHYNQNVNDLVDFIDSIEEEHNDENLDKIYIDKDDLGYGGVLDKEELSTLHDMINDDDDDDDDDENIVINIVKKDKIEIFNENINDDWLELSNIIDKAIDDVQAVYVNDELTLTLNEHSMNELSPLLNKLSQDTIDILSRGDEVNLKIVLNRDKNNE